MLRNVWCPHYSDCLTTATGKNTPFTCENCEHRNNSQGKPDPQEIKTDAQRCLILIMVVLNKQLFKKWNDLKKKEGKNK